MEDGRELRQFDLEAQRRQRKLFVGLMIGFAILAVLAGILLAIWIIDPLGDPKIRPPEPAEPPPIEPIGETFVIAIEDDRPPEDPKVPSAGPKQRLDGDDIDRGMARLRSALDACARTHGAIDGTLVTLDFSVGGNGRVEESFPRRPHDKTPLGLCVANVVRTKGQFRKSREGLRDIHRTVKLRRPDL